jgi:APA family basic amino acid/polyamine antiporter
MSTEATAAPALKRAIGRRMLIVFIVGDILGAGIYALAGKLAGFVGGAIWVPFAIGFVIAGLTAGSYAELVGKYPKAAGAALYTHRAFGKPFVTFLVAFAVMMSGVSSAAAAAIAFGGDYLQHFVASPWWLAAFGFLALITAINFIGISESIKVNFVLTMIEVTGLVIVIVVGIIGIARGAGDLSRAVELHAPDGALLGVLGATALGFYALIGFEDSVNLAEECDDPARTFPRALFIGICLTGVVYITIAIIAVALVPPARLAESKGPLLDVVTAAGVSFPAWVFALIALFAICNTALINMIMASRLLYGMANEKIVPGAFARVHRARGTPWVAILFTVAIAGALISTGDVKQLASTTTLLLLVVFGIVNVAVLVLRRKPVDHPHFRTPTWAAALGAIATLGLATPIAGRDPKIYLTAAILLGVGAALWGINRLVTGRRVTELDPENLIK